MPNKIPLLGKSLNQGKIQQKLAHDLGCFELLYNKSLRFADGSYIDKINSIINYSLYKEEETTVTGLASNIIKKVANQNENVELNEKTLDGSTKRLRGMSAICYKHEWNMEAILLYFKASSLDLTSSLPIMIGGYLYIGYRFRDEVSEAWLFEGGQIGGPQFLFLPINSECILLSTHGDSVRAKSLLPLICTQSFEYVSKHTTLPSLNETVNDTSFTAKSQLSVCVGCNAHLGVAMVGDYSAIEFLKDHPQFGKINLSHFSQNFLPATYYQDICARQLNLAQLDNIKIWEAIDAHYLFLRPTLNYLVPHSLQVLHAEEGESANTKIKILLNVRTHTRTCAFTKNDLLLIYNSLSCLGKEVVFVFDGMTKPSSRKFTRKELNIVEKEESFYESLLASDNDPFETISIVGEEFLVKGKSIVDASLSIQTYGSGFLFPYIYSIKTIMLASFSHALNNKILKERDKGCYKYFPLKVISPEAPTPEEAIKLPSDLSAIKNNSDLLRHGLYNENYKIDFNIVARECVNLLST